MGVHASNWAEPQPYWNYELVRTAGVAAWQHIVAHVGMGDGAPRERVAYLFSWLEQLVGAPEVGRLMRGALDGGSDLADLAARRVEVATAVSDRSRWIEGFDATAFLRDVGRWRAVGAEALRPEPATADEPDPLDLSDDSWANRRQFALRQLRHELTRDAKLPLVPDLNSAISNVWRQRRLGTGRRRQWPTTARRARTICRQSMASRSSRACRGGRRSVDHRGHRRRPLDVRRVVARRGPATRRGRASAGPYG